MTRKDGRVQDPERGPVDELLDAALAQFTNVEARQGMDERILTHLRLRRERPAQSLVAWLPLAFAFTMVVWSRLPLI